MNPNAQRIAIAEACSWEWKSSQFIDFGATEHRKQWMRNGTASPLPDYLNDLNAMHEAVMCQPQTTRMKINEALMNLIDASAPFCLDRTINATAAQRAKAFLRALGKWNDAA